MSWRQDLSVLCRKRSKVSYLPREEQRSVVHGLFLMKLAFCCVQIGRWPVTCTTRSSQVEQLVVTL